MLKHTKTSSYPDITIATTFILLCDLAFDQSRATPEFLERMSRTLAGS
jgi:hypothetical protein